MSLFTTYLPYFVLVLTLLVFVHEYGHYWVGRRFGIHAEVFSIGFGPELIGWTDRNGTRWKISAIPLGGYVEIRGDTAAAKAGLRTGDEVVRLGDSRVNRYEDITEAQFLHLSKPMPVEYLRGSQLLKSVIVPTYCERTDRFSNTMRLGDYGMDQLVRPVVGGFTADSPAEAAGLKVGDLLLQ